MVAYLPGDFWTSLCTPRRLIWLVSPTTIRVFTGRTGLRFPIRGRVLHFWRWVPPASLPCDNGEPRKDALKVIQRGTVRRFTGSPKFSKLANPDDKGKLFDLAHQRGKYPRQVSDNDR